ncbi:hypothetical protein ACPX19_11240 [Winogradskyella sp. HB-48]|uniref:hypothetical protein n=1 Tax=Winogradskyella sp. HB-48 TaxID=3416808 RepID=UPI003CF7904C
MSDNIRSRVIQANPEFVNGKHFQDLVDIINSYELDDLISFPMIRRISAFIGFKDSDMQDIADIQSKKDFKV